MLGPRQLDMGNSGLTGLKWSSFPVEQRYNPTNQPVNVDTAEILGNVHSTWDGVGTSDFNINLAGEALGCPSLVDECEGAQFFDGYNDFAWLDLDDPNVLGVAWSGTHPIVGPESDIALNIGDLNWGDFDAATVALHEVGHLIGISHSSTAGAVMEPFYGGPRRSLHQDDMDAIIYLYDTNVTGSVEGKVMDTNGKPVKGATVVLEGTSLQGKTKNNGTYKINGVPDPVTYTVTASKSGFESSSFDRQVVDGSTAVDFTLTATNGGGDDGGGNSKGACPPAKAAKGKC